MKNHTYQGVFLDPETGSATEGWLVTENGMIVGLDNSQPGGASSVTRLPGTVVPGMIDSHVHLSFSGEGDPIGTLQAESQNQAVMRSIRNLGAHLRAGITTVRDLGGPYNLSVDLARAVEADLLTGPRIVPSGHNITMTGGHGHSFGREADGPDEVRKAARAEIKSGARVIKFMATGGILTAGVAAGAEAMTEAEMRAGVEEAHKAGLMTATHAQGLAGVKNALRAGIDTIEHGAFDTFDDEAFQLFADRERPRWLVPTLAAPAGILNHADELPAWMIDKTRSVAEKHRANVMAAFNSGVRIAAGTDAGTPFNPHGGLPTELALMHAAGMSTADVFRSVTTEAAAAVGLAGRIGTFAAGAAADLVALDGDPLQDVGAWARPLAVVSRGVQVG